ncbi:site-specific DNA-methyltransferase [Methanolobus profundi]|uniref:Adenine-specific DNA-methyltransferase n=1 Tax=Methanolobus profundi TaxID=487685 RepID=A0A1I4TW68_9EURY|nr:site-specific DNA-methyltransferase [Methanolobus profundi]SFM80831.1 adenine-specific DNA-methyltransferase [Methanolobus profundi]
MDELKMHSPNFAEENVAKLEAMFPNCVTESKDENGDMKKSIDFDLLRQEISTHIVDGPQERYQLNWPGKREALLTANAPISKTLRPCREESVDFDTTENLFIEGDNLDVLKLLQETCLGNVKMIYIDPPYNTGKDFIYSDNFAESTEEYLLDSGQKDEEGNRLVANTDSNGRFHSDWLSMMYSRVKLARNLLKDDGVLFISIDDGEVNNLTKICDEIFGAENKIGLITVVSNLKGRSDDKYYATAHNYLVAYEKLDFTSLGVPLPDKYLKDYPEVDNLGRKYRLQGLRKRGDSARRIDRPNMYYPFYVNPATLEVSLQKNNEYSIEVFPFLSDGEEGRWRWGKETSQERINELVSHRVGKEGRYDVFQIDYAEGINGEKRIKPKTVWDGKDFANEAGSLELKELFGKRYFDTPKPTGLIKYCLEHATKKDDLILDFFAGSSTTAHSVMQLNAEDKGNRKFIMVQLPEGCDEKSEAFKAGYENIAEISKERIRLAGKKIKEENPENTVNLDIGFRVLKVDSSNMEDVYYTPDDTKQTLLFKNTDNIKKDRTSEDLLFQVLLDWGVDLTLPISKEKILDKEVYFVDGNALAACFVKDGGISEDLCKELAKREPLRVVFCDSGFTDDSVKINVEQIFKLMSPHTDVKTI